MRSLSATGIDLSALFEPRSVALIGASADASSISARPLRLLRQHGYDGTVYPVNPKYDELEGARVYPSIGAVPAPVDLALVVVPAPVVRRVLEECAAAGVRAAVVITSGFAESGAAGAQLQREIADVVARTHLRVCGPNSEGVYNPAIGLCATFSPAVDPEHGYEPTGVAGPIAVVSQSGGLAFALLNHAEERELRVGAVVSTGNEVDLDWPDYVDHLLDQPSTRVVLGFVEAIRRPERLIEVARKGAQLKKPIVLAKIGRSEAGRRAAASHTASLVGADAAYSAAFRQLGIVRVDDVDEMLDLAAYFSIGRLPAGRSVAVLTGSGGAGAWVADACATRGLDLPRPEPAIEQEIGSFIPAYGSVVNPVDITAQAALSGGFERALGLLAHSSRYAAVVPVATLVREERFFQTLPDLKQAINGAEAAIVYYSYTRASPAVLSTLAEMGIPCFSTPGRTARALSAAADYADFTRHVEDVRIFAEAAPATSLWPAPAGRLSERGARAYLASLGIPSPAERLVHSSEEAVAAFEALGGGPVALKVQSPDLAHKSDVGGVQLGLGDAEAVARAYDAITDAIRTSEPRLAIEGVLVQRMAPWGVEAFLAARREPLVGPLVVVGLGGLDVEVAGDVAMRLAPVSLAEANAMLVELRGAAMLRGTRGRPAADSSALADAIVRMSEFAVALPANVSDVEINPLLVLRSGDGVLMLDAAVEFSRVEGGEP
jgi:acetate---CoA ligase (ADP-forming)